MHVLKSTVEKDFVIIIEMKKQIKRGIFTEAFPVYNAFISRYLIQLMNLKYRPEKYDFGPRYIYRDYPEDLYHKIDEALKTDSMSQLEKHFNELRRDYELLKQELMYELHVKKEIYKRGGLMKTIELSEKHLKQFLDYCRTYRNNHDNSFLYEKEDLETFKIDENITVLLMEDNEIHGVFSVMGSLTQNGLMRVRIYHCKIDGYRVLFNHMNGLIKEKGYRLFMPEESHAASILMDLGFKVESKSYRMVFENDKSNLRLPQDMSFEPLSEENMDVWIRIYESSFGTVTREALLCDLKSPYVLPDGMMLLKHNDYIGLIVLSFDDNEMPEIENICVLPDYRNRGYGKILLSYGINTILNGYGKPTLSVSNQNNAYYLYKNSGFEIQKTYLVMTFEN